MSDYILMGTRLSFPSGSLDGDTTCTSFTILDDDAFEAEESLTLQMTAAASGVDVTPLTATVIIQDNDGKTSIVKLVLMATSIQRLPVLRGHSVKPRRCLHAQYNNFDLY